MAQKQGSNEVQALMEKLIREFHEEDDRELPHRAELDRIFGILVANKDIVPSPDKKDALAALLPKIDDALQQCKARTSNSKQPAIASAKAKKKLPSVSDCNPFRAARSPPSSFSLESLMQETISILGEAPPPPPQMHAEVAEEKVYYEWTTSYVDDNRIYGWSEDADKVVEALVGPDAAAAEGGGGHEVMFRAAGIVGIHGSGKTALAQKVFVHEKIKDNFPLRLWVCVGPPDSKDRAGLLYRMLDNLGLDTAKLEVIVDSSDAVKASTNKENSKIGVLLFVLYVTLYKTKYLIVFDDIRAYDGDWHSNLTLQPPREGEWFERLAYGLPKARKSAVLVTCRKEDDARAMVRTGRVFRPPKMDTADGWKLFEREYREAKNKKKGGDGKEEEEDKLYKELEEMKEHIVDKCLGLPVAIVEAAKGFAVLDPLPPEDNNKLAGAAETKTEETVHQAEPLA